MLAERDAFLRRLRAGESQAFREVERTVRRSVRLNRARIPRDDQDGVVQEVLLGVWKAVSKPEFELRHAFKTYLDRIVANRCADWVRRQKRRRRMIACDDLQPAHLPEDPAPGPEEICERMEQVGVLNSAIQGLDEFSRLLLRLKYIDPIKLSNAEIGEIVGMSAEQVAQRLLAIRKRLLKSMKSREQPRDLERLLRDTLHAMDERPALGARSAS